MNNRESWQLAGLAPRRASRLYFGTNHKVPSKRCLVHGFLLSSVFPAVFLQFSFSFPAAFLQCSYSYPVVFLQFSCTFPAVSRIPAGLVFQHPDACGANFPAIVLQFLEVGNPPFRKLSAIVSIFQEQAPGLVRPITYIACRAGCEVGVGYGGGRVVVESHCTTFTLHDDATASVRAQMGQGDPKQQSKGRGVMSGPPAQRTHPPVPPSCAPTH